MASNPLTAGWFGRHPVVVAYHLIGCWLNVERDGVLVRARIVETEAYAGDEDGASHATMYRTGRLTLAQAPGLLYMQLSYGIHTMTNVVAHRPGELGAVLLRAADDPVVGRQVVEARSPAKLRRFLQGPGNLSRGMGMRLSDTLEPVTTGPPIWIEQGDSVKHVSSSARVGISRAVEARWRFFDPTAKSVSRSRRGDVVVVDDLERLVRDLEMR